jgi:hypothetical protein
VTRIPVCCRGRPSERTHRTSPFSSLLPESLRGKLRSELVKKNPTMLKGSSVTSLGSHMEYFPSQGPGGVALSRPYGQA